MDKKSFSAAILLVTSLSFTHSLLVLADSQTIHQMAQVVMRINHYPGAADKEFLHGVAESGSAAERTMASALLNMEHRVQKADKARLSDIIKDRAQPDNIRDLATIIQNFNHMASEADKAKLAGM